MTPLGDHEAPGVCFNHPDDLANVHEADDTSARRRDARSFLNMLI